MKKITLIFVSVMTLMCLVLTSCEKKKGDVLKGTWKLVPFNSSSGATEIYDMTYVFDGKGNYKFTSESGEGVRKSKGTYTIKEKKYVILYYTKYTVEGDYVGEDSQLMELDLDSDPPTLTADLYDNRGDLLMTVVFEKL